MPILRTETIFFLCCNRVENAKVQAEALSVKDSAVSKLKAQLTAFRAK